MTGQFLGVRRLWKKVAAFSLILLTGFASGSACGVFDDRQVDGTFRLESIGGSSVPVAIQGNSLLIISQTVELRRNGTVRLTEVSQLQAATTPQPEQTQVFDGTWVFDGGHVVVSTPREIIEYAFEEGDRVLRSVKHTFLVASLSVFHEYLLRRAD
jgi:hypothetical protein